MLILAPLTKKRKDVFALTKQKSNATIFVMNNRQIEELAKTCLDMGKLLFASLALGFFQSNLPTSTILAYEFFGLTFSAGFIIMGLKLLGRIEQ